MKIQCDKCGYMLGGIEVKENYGCNDCNPFYKNLKSMNGGNPVCPDCLTYDKCAKHSDKLNPPIIGNTHSAVNSVPVMDTACKNCGQINGFHLDGCLRGTIPKAPTRPPLPIKYCGICARILTQTPIGTYYDTDTTEMYNHWRFTCPEYRWWKIWDRYHSNWRCNENGDTYSYEA